MKKVLITGGNSGLGLEVAKQLLKKDYEVIILGKNKDKLQKVKDDLNNPNLSTIQCDLRDSEEIEEKLAEIGELDILINNAGIIAYQQLEDHEVQNIKDRVL